MWRCKKSLIFRTTFIDIFGKTVILSHLVKGFQYNLIDQGSVWCRQVRWILHGTPLLPPSVFFQMDQGCIIPHL
jgi:hypothetical protein